MDPLPIPPLSGLAKNGDIGKRRKRESKIKKKKHIRDLKISSGIRGETAKGGAVIGGPGGLYLLL